MTNSERFLAAFRSIDSCLHGLTGARTHLAFRAVLHKAGDTSRVVHRYMKDLEQFGRLRNAIVHEMRGDAVIAEPNDESVKRIEEIEKALREPPGVVPEFSRDVKVLPPDAPLSEAVLVMREKSYSQIPIYSREGDFTGLLTVNTIARWLGAQTG